MSNLWVFARSYCGFFQVAALLETFGPRGLCVFQMDAVLGFGDGVGGVHFVTTSEKFVEEVVAAALDVELLGFVLKKMIEG